MSEEIARLHQPAPAQSLITDNRPRRSHGLGATLAAARKHRKKAPTAPKGGATPIQEVMPLAQGLNETTHMTDARAFIAWLDAQPAVAVNRKAGTQGYCMGGPIAFRTAAAVPASSRTPVPRNTSSSAKL